MRLFVFSRGDLAFRPLVGADPRLERALCYLFPRNYTFRNILFVFDIFEEHARTFVRKTWV